MENEQQSKFTKWLETIQLESWQLELVISGFAIFLLLGAYEPMKDFNLWIEKLSFVDRSYRSLQFPYEIMLGSWHVLVFNLLIHVLLRGLWISTVGLRYVSGDIDFEKLRLSPRFDQFLKKRIGNFDDYIHQLEKVCSTIFAFTFLILFILISIGLYIGVISFIGESIDWIGDRLGFAGKVFIISILVLFILSSLLYFIDFISLGWVKRLKKFSRFYFPIYRFYSNLTLAFIYRPLYYNLIDNRFGKRVILLLIPYIFIFLSVTSFSVHPYGYLPFFRESQSLNRNSYDDIAKKKEVAYSARIPSKYVGNGFLELFLPYNARFDDEVIKMLCPDLVPSETGVFWFGNFDLKTIQMNADKALSCHSQRFNITVNDSLFTDLSFRFYQHPQYGRFGLLTILDVDYLPRGEHNLDVNVKLRRKSEERDTLIFERASRIPFWKE